MNSYLPDIIENYENAAEQRLDEMTEGLPLGKFKCSCGTIADLVNAMPASSNPYSEPICLNCYEEAKAAYESQIRKDTINEEQTQTLN